MDEPIDIRRAWQDEEYRNSLTPDQLAHLPALPNEDVELSEEELNHISGGTYYTHVSFSYYWTPLVLGGRPPSPGPGPGGGGQ